MTSAGTRGAAPAREALRAATEAVHQRLHALPALAALASGRLSRAGYAAILARLLGFHEALEARLGEHPALAAFGVDAAARRRAHLLRADLAFLDVSIDVRSPRLPPFPNAAAALGGLYVAEGSTLGGLHLARALDPILPPGEDGRRFLLGYGARHGEMWRAFCAAIERCGAARPAREHLIEGASATFAAFEAWFAAPDLAHPGPRSGMTGAEAL